MTPDPLTAALSAAVTALTVALAILWRRTLTQSREARKDYAETLSLVRKDQDEWRLGTLKRIEDLAQSISSAINNQSIMLTAQHQEIRLDQREQWKEIKDLTDRMFNLMREAREDKRQRG